MHLDRILQSQGFGTRRQCRALVTAGEVIAGGRPQLDPHADFPTEGLELVIRGERWKFRERVYVALHKPLGFECSHAATHHPSVFSLLPPQLEARGVQCVGRLDQDTSGLLLLTDDGPMLHALASPRRHVQKVYEVTTASEIAAVELSALERGVELHGEEGVVQALAVERRSERSLRITIAEGRYHQVRRMVAAVGHQVVGLHRVAFGELTLESVFPPVDLGQSPTGSAGPGAWRYLEREELAL